MYKNIAPQLKSNLNLDSDSFLKNKEMMLEKIEHLNPLLNESELGLNLYSTKITFRK